MRVRYHTEEPDYVEILNFDLKEPAMDSQRGVKPNKLPVLAGGRPVEN